VEAGRKVDSSDFVFDVFLTPFHSVESIQARPHSTFMSVEAGERFISWLRASRGSFHPDLQLKSGTSGMRSRSCPPLPYLRSPIIARPGSILLQPCADMEARLKSRSYRPVCPFHRGHHARLPPHLVPVRAGHYDVERPCRAGSAVSERRRAGLCGMERADAGCGVCDPALDTCACAGVERCVATYGEWNLESGSKDAATSGIHRCPALEQRSTHTIVLLHRGESAVERNKPRWGGTGPRGGAASGVRAGQRGSARG